MAVFLIYSIIVMLVVIGMDNTNKLKENFSENTFIPHSIKTDFYLIDNTLNEHFNRCSLSYLKLDNFDNNFFNTYCFKIPDTLIEKNITITNINPGVYEVCYDEAMSTFSTSPFNKNKEIFEKNGGLTSCVNYYYNDTNVSIGILNEIQEFFNGETGLMEANIGLSADTTFVNNTKLYTKSDYIHNNTNLFSIGFADNTLVYISNIDSDIIYYFNTISKELFIFTKNATIIAEKVQQLNYLKSKVSNVYYDVVDTNEIDGSYKITKK